MLRLPVVNNCLPTEVRNDVEDFEVGQGLDIIRTLETGTVTDYGRNH